MNYLILGNSAAGLYAAETLRRRDKNARITVLTQDTVPSYSRCLTTYFLAGDIPEEQLFLRSPAALAALDITWHYGCTVTGLAADQHLVFTTDGKTYSYDKLLIAIGASAVTLDLPGATLPEVFTLRHREDALRIKQQLAPGKNALIIGGGLVSLKSAYALRKQGLQVSVLVSSGQILSQMLNEEAARLLEEHLSGHGIRILLHQDATAILGQDHVEGVRLSDGSELPAQLVLIGKGVRPNLQPFLNSGLELGQGIRTNAYLETNLPGVYAAGDIAETWDRVHARYRINAIWPNASNQGRIAGANMAGGREIYPGSQGMNAVDFFGLRVISGGIIKPPKEDAGSYVVHDVLRRSSDDLPRYQRLVWKGNRLCGFVLLGEPSYAGLLTTLVQSGKELPHSLVQALKEGKRTSLHALALHS